MAAVERHEVLFARVFTLGVVGEGNPREVTSKRGSKTDDNGASRRGRRAGRDHGEGRECGAADNGFGVHLPWWFERLDAAIKEHKPIGLLKKNSTARGENLFLYVHYPLRGSEVKPLLYLEHLGPDHYGQGAPFPACPEYA